MLTTQLDPSQPSSAPAARQRGTLTFILMTAFLNLAGLGIINPIAPFMVKQYAPNNDSALLVALLITSYSLSQFIAVPTLGALSDRYGRRPVLLISLLGSALGYVIYGLGGSLFALFWGRIIDGLTGGNIAVINAYMADISKPAERTKAFGLLGAAAGMGFIIGPALGGFIYRLTDNYAAPVFFAAVITFLNVVWGWFVMPESLLVKNRAAIKLRHMNPLTQLGAALRLKHLRLLLLGTFIWSAVFAIAQSNFAYLAEDRFGWTLDMIGVGFFAWGVISIIVQVWLIRKLLPRFGEFKLAVGGLAIMALGFALIGIVTLTGWLPLIWISLAVTAVGNALATPTLTALLSQVASEQEQGRVQGGGQSVQAMARVAGPIWGGVTYQQFGQAAPYFTGAFGLLLTIGIISAGIPALRSRRAALETSPSTTA